MKTVLVTNKNNNLSASITMSEMTPGMIAIIVKGNIDQIGLIVMRTLSCENEEVMNLNSMRENGCWKRPLPSGIRVIPFKAGQEITLRAEN